MTLYHLLVNIRLISRHLIQPRMSALEISKATSAPGFFRCALDKIEGTPSREAIIDALEALGKFDIGLGEPLDLSPTEHQASHRVWPTILKDGALVPFKWTEIAQSAEQWKISDEKYTRCTPHFLDGASVGSSRANHCSCGHHPDRISAQIDP